MRLDRPIGLISSLVFFWPSGFVSLKVIYFKSKQIILVCFFSKNFGFEEHMHVFGVLQRDDVFRPDSAILRIEFVLDACNAGNPLSF